MIISLDEARKINADLTLETCQGLEVMVRRLTNNNFQLPKFRLEGLRLDSSAIYAQKGRFDIFKVGDTVEINGTDYNDGLYQVREVESGHLLLDGEFIPEAAGRAILTKVVYPADVVEGVKKLLAYDVKMADKIGVKSESVARWSVTYYDVTAAESREGYPAVLLGFLDKYRKVRWS